MKERVAVGVGLTTAGVGVGIGIGIARNLIGYTPFSVDEEPAEVKAYLSDVQVDIDAAGTPIIVKMRPRLRGTTATARPG